MSRRNSKSIKEAVDNSKNIIYTNNNDSKRVLKKVGHKGDYAIVKNKSNVISLNQTGNGTSANPYVYTFDLQKNFTSTIADYKNRNSKLTENLANQKSKIIKNSYLINKQELPLKDMISFESTFVFGEENHLITNKILNEKNSINFTVSSEPSRERFKLKNNCFYIYFNQSLPNIPYVEYSIDNTSLDLDIIEIKNEHIKFKIKELEMDNFVSNYFLSTQEKTKINFVIEWGKKTFNTNNNTNNNVVMNMSSSSVGVSASSGSGASSSGSSGY
tara:strand:- start:748 stop:1566 length:819 start_codon:yes stop_codon:yes gene_type:complete